MPTMQERLDEAAKQFQRMEITLKAQQARINKLERKIARIPVATRRQYPSLPKEEKRGWEPIPEDVQKRLSAFKELRIKESNTFNLGDDLTKNA